MSSMKKTKEGINLKKLFRLKNTGSIFVFTGLLMIFVIHGENHHERQHCDEQTAQNRNEPQGDAG